MTPEQAEEKAKELLGHATRLGLKIEGWILYRNERDELKFIEVDHATQEWKS